MKKVASRSTKTVNNACHFSQISYDTLKQAYARRLTPDEDGRYIATIQEFPGLIAHGENVQEAINNLEVSAASWIDSMMAMGKEIPSPVVLHGYSGKIALRIPRTLHKRVAEMAAADAVSINQWLTSAISHYLGGHQAIRLAVQSLVHNNLNLKIDNIIFNNVKSTPPDFGISTQFRNQEFHQVKTTLTPTTALPVTVAHHA